MCNPLREKFEEWRAWLLGDDPHSIRNQIQTMMWDSAVYQSINKARAYTPTDAEGRIELNAMVHHFIDRCFFDTQMMAIRRLMDRETRCGDRSVISLWRLLDDMEKHVSLLTRRNLLACLDLPYDYEKTMEDVRKRYPFTGSVKPTLMGDDRKQCSKSEHAHACIDALAGVRASQRSPSDMARVAVIQWLEDRLRKCTAIYTYVNKFLAHSATAESRTALMDKERNITLGQILSAHEIICQIAESIGQNLFLHGIGTPLPTAAFNQFEYFEKPCATEETLPKLREWWHGYYASTHNWLEWDWQSEYSAYTARSGA